MTYAARWAGFWSLVGAVGVGLSFLVWEPFSVLTVFLTAALCVGFLLVLLAPAAGSESPLAAVRWSRMAARAGLAGAGVVAIGAFTRTVPVLGLALLMAVVLSSPRVVERARQWRGLHSPPAERASTARPSSVRDAVVPDDRPPPVEASSSRPGPGLCRLDVTAPEAQAMTDRELCRQWRHTFEPLQSARTTHELLRVVAQRQVYMDEMERRSPTGLQAWLDSGARAAGGPERFLAQQRRTDDQPDAA